MYTGEQDRTLGNHVGWTVMKRILGNKTEQYVITSDGHS